VLALLEQESDRSLMFSCLRRSLDSKTANFSFISHILDKLDTGKQDAYDEDEIKALYALAAVNGNLQALIEFPSKFGLPWNYYSVFMASYHGHLEIVTYAMENELYAMQHIHVGTPFDLHSDLIKEHFDLHVIRELVLDSGFDDIILFMLQKPVELIYLLAMSNSHQEIVTYVERTSGIAVLESLKTFAPATVMNTLILQSDEDFFIWYMSSTEFVADDQMVWERTICSAIENANPEALMYLLLSFGKKFGTYDFGFFSQQTHNHNTDWCNSYVDLKLTQYVFVSPTSCLRTDVQRRMREADRRLSVCFILKQMSDPSFMRTRSWSSAMNLRFPKFMIYYFFTTIILNQSTRSLSPARREGQNPDRLRKIARESISSGTDGMA
jgi:hypothetical protein